MLYTRETSNNVECSMRATEFFKLLSDDIRLKSILMITEEKELCVCELMVALDEVSQPKISRHLALLKSAGVLLTRKQKQWVFYAINPNLPLWTQQVLATTLQENQALISPHLHALQLMGDRPTRMENCCN